jgi:4-amino-4-deoxy-L-arabinose transferase-like glycosyltransferase
VRLGWVFDQSRKPEPDAKLPDQFEYLQLGRNLLQNRTLYFHDLRFDQNVYAYRAPGYPAFVAMFGGNVIAVRVAQALIDTSTVLAIYLLARRWLNSTGALTAAALVAFNPFLVYFTALILTETLFTAMLAWGIYLLTGAGRQSLFGILLLALTVHVRPSAIGLVILLAFVAGLRVRFRTAIIQSAFAAAVVCLALAPWAIRNRLHPSLKTWIWTTTNSGITTYDGFHDAATGASDQSAFLDRLLPDLKAMTEIQRDDFLGREAHKWIRAHPGRSAKLALVKIARTWSPVPLSSNYGTRLYVVAGLIYSVPLYILFLLGICCGQVPRSVKFLLAAPAIYFTAIHAVSVGSLRYRVPAEPPMGVIAGAAVCAWTSRRRRNHSIDNDLEETDPHRQSVANGPTRLDNPRRPV